MTTTTNNESPCTCSCQQVTQPNFNGNTQCVPMAFMMGYAVPCMPVQGVAVQCMQIPVCCCQCLGDNPGYPDNPDNPDNQSPSVFIKEPTSSGLLTQELYGVTTDPQFNVIAVGSEVTAQDGLIGLLTKYNADMSSGQKASFPLNHSLMSVAADDNAIYLGGKVISASNPQAWICKLDRQLNRIAAKKITIEHLYDLTLHKGELYVIGRDQSKGQVLHFSSDLELINAVEMSTSLRGIQSIGDRLLISSSNKLFTLNSDLSSATVHHSDTLSSFSDITPLHNGKIWALSNNSTLLQMDAQMNLQNTLILPP